MKISDAVRDNKTDDDEDYDNGSDARDEPEDNGTTCTSSNSPSTEGGASGDNVPMYVYREQVLADDDVSQREYWMAGTSTPTREDGQESMQHFDISPVVPPVEGQQEVSTGPDSFDESEVLSWDSDTDGWITWEQFLRDRTAWELTERIRREEGDSRADAFRRNNIPPEEQRWDAMISDEETNEGDAGFAQSDLEDKGVPGEEKPEEEEVDPNKTWFVNIRGEWRLVDRKALQGMEEDCRYAEEPSMSRSEMEREMEGENQEDDLVGKEDDGTGVTEPDGAEMEKPRQEEEEVGIIARSKAFISRSSRVGGAYPGDTVPNQNMFGRNANDNLQPNNWMRGTSTPGRGYRDGMPDILCSELRSQRDVLRSGLESISPVVSPEERPTEVSNVPVGEVSESKLTGRWDSDSAGSEVDILERNWTGSEPSNSCEVSNDVQMLAERHETKQRTEEKNDLEEEAEAEYSGELSDPCSPPLAPRVETRWGQREVSNVPSESGEQLLISFVNNEDESEGEDPEDPGDEQQLRDDQGEAAQQGGRVREAGSPSPVPREKGRGLSEVRVVPDCKSDQNLPELLRHKPREATEESAVERVADTGPGTGRTGSLVCKTIATTSVNVTQKSPLSSSAMKGKNRRFYQRRQQLKQLKSAAVRNRQKRESKRSPVKVKDPRKKKHQKELQRNPDLKSVDSISEMSSLNNTTPAAADELAQHQGPATAPAQAMASTPAPARSEEYLSALMDAFVADMSDEEEKKGEEKMEVNDGDVEKDKGTEIKEVPKTGDEKKPRKGRKALECSFTGGEGASGCNFKVIGKAKMDAHMEAVHGVKIEKRAKPNLSNKSTPASSQGQTPNDTITVSSNDASPELVEIKTKKRGRTEDDVTGIEESKKLRMMLEKLQTDAKNDEKEEEGEKDNGGKGKGGKKGKKGKNDDVTEFEEFKKRLRETEKELSKAKQEAEMERNRAAGLEQENVEWRKQAKVMLGGGGKKVGEKIGISKSIQSEIKKTIEALQAKDDELKKQKEELQQYKGASKLQFAAVEIVTKKAREAEEKLKNLEKRQVCRKYQATQRCNKGSQCRFAHVLPEVAPALKNLNAKEPVKNLNVLNETGNNAGNKAGVKQGGGNNKQKDCIHFERGWCKKFDECEFKHDPTKYGTRARSGSHGSNTGFQKAPRYTGDLGAVLEEIPEQLPTMPDPVSSESVVQEDIKSLQEAAKKYGVAEGKMLDQLKQLRTSAILDANNWKDLIEAVRSKQDS